MTRQEVHEKFRAARAALAAIPADRLADLPGVPPRRARIELRRLGESHLQRPRLARPVLSAGRRPLRDLPRAGRRDRLDAAWSRRAIRVAQHCLVHCGFEPAAVLSAHKGLRDVLRMAVWQMT